MRYLLTLIVVLALASPVMSDCNTLNKEAIALDDGAGKTGLPQITSFAPHPDCHWADWYFEFYRPDEGDEVEIKTTIECMGEQPGGLVTVYSSETYEVDEENPYPFSGPNVRITNHSLGQLRIDRHSGTATGLFADMKLEVKDFRYEQ